MKRRRVKRRPVKNKTTTTNSNNNIINNCTHPIKLNNEKLCGVCGAILINKQLQIENINTRSSSSSNNNNNNDNKRIMETYSSSSSKTNTINVSGGHTLAVSQTEAEHLSYKEIKSLLTSKHISLVLDLDATLIHATVQRNEQVKYEYEKKIKYENDLLIKKEKMENDNNGNNHIIKLDDDSSDNNNNNNGPSTTIETVKFSSSSTPPPESIISSFNMLKTRHFIKLRPNLYNFLNKTYEKFRLHIYTHGTREYAKNIAKIIDPTGKYFHGRILSRSDCPAGLKQKELKRLFPCGVSMVAVVDDRDDVWLNSLDNLFKIEPYKYWKGTKEINNHTGSSLLEESKKKEISEKSNNDDDDNHNNKIATINPVATSNNNTLRFEQNEIDEQLNICYEILNKAHTEFYNQLLSSTINNGNTSITAMDTNTNTTTTTTTTTSMNNNIINAEDTTIINNNIKKDQSIIVTEEMIINQLNNNGPSIPKILTTIRKSILNSCNIVFTGIIPQEIRFIEHPFIRLVYFYGGQVSQQVQNGVTHVVCSQPGTEKSIYGSKQGCYIVTKDWFLHSITKWKHMDEKQYMFSEMNKYLSNSNPPGSSQFAPTGLKLNWNIKGQKKYNNRSDSSDDGANNNTMMKNINDDDDDRLDTLLNNEVNDDDDVGIEEPCYKRLRTDEDDDMMYDDDGGGDGDGDDYDEMDYGDEEMIDEDDFL